MAENKERYSVLKPLNIKERYELALELINFFNPINTCRYREKKHTKTEGIIYPLSLFDFFEYMKEEKGIDAFKYTSSILKLIHKLEDEDMLNKMASNGKGAPQYSNTYYSFCELTKLQQKQPCFFLGKVLGMQFLRDVYLEYTVRIEGIYNDENKSATGSGILINNNTILTCAHNIKDIREPRCFLGANELKIIDTIYHEKHDIGIIKIEKIVDIINYPYFGEPRVLDKTLTLGYPPFRGMIEAALIAQSGEINAISLDWQKAENITISSITRPGNSGGPVISEEGYIVGIVVNASNEVNSISNEKDINECKNSIPFYNAISSNEIIKILKELDPEVKYEYEDYK